MGFVLFCFVGEKSNWDVVAVKFVTQLFKAHFQILIHLKSLDHHHLLSIYCKTLPSIGKDVVKLDSRTLCESRKSGYVLRVETHIKQMVRDL